ncbi:RHS repeat domain-containing protein [Hoylesella buccalis]|uniref:DUF6973 domain-containing protein n=1 Tax=Hoylesella buccalis DNF00853 TaxID=1401074 RepID=A0A096AS71_9BACT|nr:RHS repeat-associated core domain-containing protein [Hoylesella buccalis]KGF33472.1 hypothetical protein HMPREF2137_11200 [Hoylesella buccalis DNF00853]
MREEFRGEKQNLYMGDRRTEVNHPASGKTSFTYNPLGNVLTKQTANMAEEGKMITYNYDYHRLTGINYPDHPENNVMYHYGRGKLACTMPSAANRRVELNAKEFDEETGLYYYGARYYEPRLSLWMTCDPLQEKYINISTYCYTFNRPVVLIDPNGEFPILPIVKGIIKLSVMYYTTATALENSSKSDLRQIGYGMKHPINALKVGYYDEGSNNISTIASNFEINIVNKANLGKRGDGTSGNAIRHTLWQAIITKEIDATHTERIGNAHEDNSKLDMNQKVFDNMASADASADLHNNIIGRKIGTNNPKASNVNLAKLVLKEYKEKGLWTVTKINGKYHLQRTKISQKQYELGVQEINKKNNYGKNK